MGKVIHLDSAGGGGGGAVDSVNGQVGVVLLESNDIPDVSGVGGADVAASLDLLDAKITALDNIAVTTLNTWVLDAGDSYYQDFAHNLGTDDIGLEIYDSVTKESVQVDKIDRTSINNVRIFIIGNTASLRVIAWATAGAGGGRLKNTVTNPASGYTAINNDFITIDVSGGDKTINLPLAGANNGATVIIKRTDGSVNNVVVDAAASETIDGDLTINLTLQYESVTLICDGSNWFIN